LETKNIPFDFLILFSKYFLFFLYFFLKEQLSLQANVQNNRQKMEIILNKQSRASIEKTTGIPYDNLLTMDIETIDAAIEKKIGKKLKLKPFTDYQLIGRGSVYLYLNRIFDFHTDKLNRYIDRIK